MVFCALNFIYLPKTPISELSSATFNLYVSRLICCPNPFNPWHCLQHSCRLYLPKAAYSLYNVGLLQSREVIQLSLLARSGPMSTQLWVWPRNVNEDAKNSQSTTCNKMLDKSNYWQPQFYHQDYDGKFELIKLLGIVRVFPSFITALPNIQKPGCILYWQGLRLRGRTSKLQ